MHASFSPQASVRTPLGHRDARHLPRQPAASKTRSLLGRTALVTGAARRIGRATALALAAEGANVVLHYRRSAREAEELREHIIGLGTRAWTIEADFGEQGSYVGLLERARELAGPVEILVNNASVFPAGRLETTSLEELLQIVEVNAWAPIALSRAFARPRGKGSIVNILDARIGGHDPHHAAYHLSKQVLAAATKATALEFAPHIRVNAVAPGPILPPEGKDKQYLERVAAKLPLRRHGTPEDVAQAVAFLAQAEFVTGQIVYVDGGQHLAQPTTWSL